MRKKHLVRLRDAQRADLEGRFAGPLTLRQRNRVQVLLRADAGETDADIADDLGISAQTAANVRKRFAAEGLDAALTEKPRSSRPGRSSVPARTRQPMRPGHATPDDRFPAPCPHSDEPGCPPEPVLFALVFFLLAAGYRVG